MIQRVSVAAMTGLGLIVAMIGTAEATAVNYSVSVTATSGPLSGTTATGTFSYDTSSIVLGGRNDHTGLLTALNFTWTRSPTIRPPPIRGHSFSTRPAR
jgi:hypothetical protein